MSSPAPGRSILMTSAPRSARFWVHQGPASTRVRSSTRMPVRGAGRCDMSVERKSQEKQAY
ncbi:Uncharacterised protein [Bordetella pertussis]|nr:Uncharacterised protein [Bordetella pertussis]CFW36764.1 Uncharacterised protein [Bordetella pertussis]